MTVTRLTVPIALVALAAGCAEPCLDASSASVELGAQTGDAFTPFTPGAQVRLLSDPEGGLAVPYSARAQGIATDEPAGLESRIQLADGSITTWEADATLECSQELDGGMLWAQQLPFDADPFANATDPLAGQTVRLTLTLSGQFRFASDSVELTLLPADD